MPFKRAREANNHRAVQKEFSFHHSFGLQYHSDLFAFILEDVNQGNEIQIFISQSDAFADSEGYRLHTKKINSGLQIDIAYGTERGLVYALFAIRRACKHNRFLLGEIDEAPKFKVRGYIEGFYGRPWSKETRKAMLEYAVSYGANTHYYAPKDDPYHRKLWREEYP